MLLWNEKKYTFYICELLKNVHICTHMCTKFEFQNCRQLSAIFNNTQGFLKNRKNCAFLTSHFASLSKKNLF